MQTDIQTDKRRDTTKLIRVFHDYTDGPKEAKIMWNN